MNRTDMILAALAITALNVIYDIGKVVVIAILAMIATATQWVFEFVRLNFAENNKGT